MQRTIQGLALAAAIALAWAAPAGAQDGKVHVQWLGQSTTKITSPKGKVILIDPFMTKNPKTPEKHKDLKALGKIDVILVTHAHFDHWADMPELARMHKIPVYAPAGFADTLIRLEVLPAEQLPRMNKSGTIAPVGPEIKITMVRAEHSPELVYMDPFTKTERTFPAGEPVGFIVELENGFKIYHMGDTGIFGDMKFIAEYYKPNLIMMPIGGHYVMSPKDAAYVTNNFLKPQHVIPFHYATNPFLKGTPEEYIQALGKTTTKVHTLNPGDGMTF